MGRKKRKPTGSPHCSPAVKSAKSLKRKYGTGSMSPGKCLRVRRALIDVNEKRTSIRQAAKNSSVSVSFLRRRLSGEVAVDSQNGPKPVFSKQEEEAIAKWLKEMAQRGMGLKPGELLDFVQSVVQKEKRKTPFVNDRPSYKWYQKFMKRNSHIIQIRIETALEASRSKLTRESMDEWYSKFRDFLIEYGLLQKPQCIYNADETNFIMGSKAGKVIGPTRSSKSTSVPHVSGASKQRLTVMFCGSADGSMIPPFMVYPEPKPRGYNVLTGGLVGSDVAFTKKGWMDSLTYEIFLKHFSKHASADRPVVLLIDSVSSHISMTAFESAKREGVLLYRIIPNATHLMQPLDKGVFGPLKQKWYAVARAHSRENPGVPIGRESFAEKLKEAYLLFYKPIILVNSFRASGIYPVDSTVIKDSDLKPGLTYLHSDEGTEDSEETKVTSTKEQLHAQGALCALETALSTPTRQKYQRRIDEGYDVVGQSPCFDTYKKLTIASKGLSRPLSTDVPTPSTSKAPPPLSPDVPTPSTSKAPPPLSPDVPTPSTSKATVELPSGLDFLANVALQQDETRQQKVSDGTQVGPTSVSPVLLELIKLPKSVKPKKIAPRRLVHTLPHHLTSPESVRTMALRELSKIKTLAEKEKRAKRKFMTTKDDKSSKRKGKKKQAVKRVSSDVKAVEHNEESDEENVTCLGCGCSWKEDEELGLGRTWVNCDVCKKWVHTDCCSEEIDVESEEPFSCPECTEICCYRVVPMSGCHHYPPLDERFSANCAINPIDFLPPETLVHIFSYLTPRDLSACIRTCRRWRQLISDSEALWKRLCLSLHECKIQVQIDRRSGFTWKETFQLNYGRNGIKRLWRQGIFSKPASLQDLPDKPFCPLDTDSWGEIFQWELDRS